MIGSLSIYYSDDENLKNLSRIWSRESMVCNMMYLELSVLHHYGNKLYGDEFESDFEAISKFMVLDMDLYNQILHKTKHEYHAVVKMMSQVLELNGLGKYQSLLHPSMTSQNLVDYSIRCAINETETILVEQIKSIENNIADNSFNGPIMGMTHGMPATPILSPLSYYREYLSQSRKELESIEFSINLSGATGVMPKYMLYIFESACADLGMGHESVGGKQYGHNLDLFDYFSRLEAILLLLQGLSNDLWHYASRGILIETQPAEQVGSSAMPHKKNPIRVENAIGNLEIATTLLSGYKKKLLITTMQRDLTDSTWHKNLSSIFGHIVKATTSLCSFLKDSKFGNTEAEIRENSFCLSELAVQCLKHEIPDIHEKIHETYRNCNDILEALLKSGVEESQILQFKEYVSSVGVSIYESELHQRLQQRPQI